MQITETIDFHPELIRALFDCGKTQTSRITPLGKEGDSFTLQHPETMETRDWQISDINRHTLHEVAMHMYKEEGFISENDFMRFWSKVYPEHLNPQRKVFVHALTPVNGGKNEDHNR
jgi:hypothetical protein